MDASEVSIPDDISNLPMSRQIEVLRSLHAKPICGGKNGSPIMTLDVIFRVLQQYFSSLLILSGNNC